MAGYWGLVGLDAGLAKLATKVGVAGLDTMGVSRAGYRGGGQPS
jgi:hypothetical protein